MRPKRPTPIACRMSCGGMKNILMLETNHFFLQGGQGPIYQQYPLNCAVTLLVQSSDVRKLGCSSIGTPFVEWEQWALLSQARAAPNPTNY